MKKYKKVLRKITAAKIMERFQDWSSKALEGRLNRNLDKQFLDELEDIFDLLDVVDDDLGGYA